MRKLAIFSLSFGIAVFLCVYLLQGGILLAAALSLLAAGICFFLQKKFVKMTVIGVLFIGFAAGCCWFLLYDVLFLDPVRQMVGQTDSVEVIAVSFSQETDYGCSVEVRLLSDGVFPVKGKLYCDSCELCPGDRITITAEIRSAELYHGEESERFTSRGYFFFLYSDTEPKINSPVKWPFFPAYFAQAFQTRVSELFPEQTRPLFLAVLTGEQSQIYDDPALLSSFRTAGVYHVLVVSGMHMAFVSSALVFLLGRRKWALALSVPILVLFAAVTGFAPSVTRALIMQLFLIGSFLTDRENDTLTSLLASLLFLLLCNPYSVSHAGLQLSFAATLGLVLISGPVSRWMNNKLSDNLKVGNRIFHKISRWCTGVLSASIGASVFTVPISCYYYGSVSLIAPITNLLTILAFTGAFMGGMIACCVSVLWMPLGKVLAYPASWLFLYARFVTKELASFPVASVSVERPSVLVWLIAVYATLLAYLCLKKYRKNFLIPAATLVLSICAICVVSSLRGSDGALTVSLLDVGQGQSVLLTADGYTAMYDCGSSDRTDSGTVACNAVKGRSNGKLDVIIFSHFDRDHVCGFPELAAGVSVGSVFIPKIYGENEMRDMVIETCVSYEIPYYEISVNTEILLGKTTLKLFAPMGEDSCLGALISEENIDFLLTGDMKKQDEIQLLKKNSLPDIEVLVVGHHGSKNSTSAELLNLTKPELALISVGYNSYGHPSEETLSRLESSGIIVYRTDLDGTISLSSDFLREKKYG